MTNGDQFYLCIIIKSSLYKITKHNDIDDIDSYVSSKILKFADDTKIVGVVSSPEGVKQLRQDLVDISLSLVK